jgi:replicative DNA helicase
MVALKSIEEYGLPFQVKVISSLLTSKEFLKNIQDILDEDQFPNPSHKWIVGEIKKYFKNYHTTISLESLKIEMKKLDNDVLKISIREQLKAAYKVDEDELEYVQVEFATFLKNQSLKKALLNSVDLLKIGDYDSIRNVVNDALKSGQDRNVGHEYEKDIESRYRDSARNPIPFPWPTFNNITQGGYGEGDLVLVFGNPKGGKSWAIVAMAAEAVKLGYNIVYYSLELGEDYVGKRFDACFTGIPVDQLSEHRSTVETAISELKGKLIIKEYSPKRASLATIESHIQTLDFKPDVIFIDYLDLLKNRTTRAERKDDIDDVYTDAKGMAKELKIPVVSPSQANRSGADKEILESTHIGGSYEKLMIGDIVISLARGRKDRLEGTGRWHFLGNRYGPDGVTFFSPKIDTSMGYFEIENQAMDDDEIFQKGVNNAKELERSEKKFLRDKFYELQS